MGRSTPPAAKIAAHWANYCLKADAPLRYDKTDDGSYKNLTCDCEQPEFTHTFCDSGEPDCMSCGRFLGYTTNAVFYAEEPERRFNGDRAHIIPWSLTQDDSVENVVLLCHGCHRVNPEQDDRRGYLDWLISRKRQTEMLKKTFVNAYIAQYPDRAARFDLSDPSSWAQVQEDARLLIDSVRAVLYGEVNR